MNRTSAAGLLLLLFTSTSALFSMYRPLSIEKREQARARKKDDYLSTFFDKNLDQIKDSFQQLSSPVRHKVLQSCGDAKPFILIACLPNEKRIDVLLNIFDKDQKSAQLFCSADISVK